MAGRQQFHDTLPFMVRAVVAMDELLPYMTPGAIAVLYRTHLPRDPEAERAKACKGTPGRRLGV